MTPETAVLDGATDQVLDEPARVVLVGGGYVTLHAYRSLTRRLRREIRAGHLEIVVISADDAHSFHGFTGEVLAGLLPYAVTRTPLGRVLRRARVLHATVTHVDSLARRVTYQVVSDGTIGQLRYDELVVGAGGLEPLHQVPGLDEHGHSLRRPGGIADLADRIARLRAAGRTPRTVRGHGDPDAQTNATSIDRLGDSTIVVAGGGVAGVELAAAIADGGAGGLSVVLVHSGQDLVPGWAADLPRLVRYAAEQLAGLAVDVRLDTSITAVDAGAAYLSDGTVIPTRTVVATIGQRAVALPGLAALPYDRQGRLVTDEDLSVAPGLWAAGDAARVRHPRSGDPLPANALWAIKAGGHVGRNVARTLRGRHTLRFRYRGLGQAASFGVGRSAAELYGVTFTGWVAWLLRLAFFLRFMPSRRTALRVLGLSLATVVRRRRPPAPVRRTEPAQEQIDTRAAA